MSEQESIHESIANAIEENRGILLTIIQKRASVKLKTKMGVEDVLQEAFISACKRLEFFTDKPEIPILVKLRKIILQTLTDKERFIHAGKRNSDRELYEDMDETKSNFLNHLADSITTPSKKVMRKECAAIVNEMLNELQEQDKLILEMRHFEQLSYEQCAKMLNVSLDAATMRYVRAIKRLKEKLNEIQGFKS